MSERSKSVLAIGAAVLLVAFIAIGLTGEASGPPSAAERVDALSAVIKCPFCAGESLADSPSSVAADYRALIAQYVDEGWTDEAIRAEFVRNFGESVILDGSTSGRFALLWALPVVAFGVGAWVIWAMRRSASRREEHVDVG